MIKKFSKKSYHKWGLIDLVQTVILLKDNPNFLNNHNHNQSNLNSKIKYNYNNNQKQNVALPN